MGKLTCLSFAVFHHLAYTSHEPFFIFVQSLDNSQVSALLESDFSIQVQATSDPANVLKGDFIQVEDGESVSVTFQNNTRGVLYFTVLNLMPLKQIKKLYPPQKEYQSALPWDASEVLPRDVPKDVKPSGTIRFSPRMTIPKRIKDRGDVQADDILKFVVGTRPVCGTPSMKLPDPWAQIDTETSEAAFGSMVQESFADGKGRLTPLRGEEAPVKWACRSIIVRTVLKSVQSVQ